MKQKDILRAAFVFDTAYDLQRGVDGLVSVAGNLDASPELREKYPNGWGRIIEIKNNWETYYEFYQGDYVDLKAIMMFRSKSGQYLFYEIQFLTKGLADLKKDFHKKYGALRTMGLEIIFDNIVKESISKMSPEELMAKLYYKPSAFSVLKKQFSAIPLVKSPVPKELVEHPADSPNSLRLSKVVKALARRSNSVGSLRSDGTGTSSSKSPSPTWVPPTPPVTPHGPCPSRPTIPLPMAWAYKQTAKCNYAEN